MRLTVYHSNWKKDSTATAAENHIIPGSTNPETRLRQTEKTRKRDVRSVCSTEAWVAIGRWDNSVPCRFFIKNEAAEKEAVAWE